MADTGLQEPEVSSTETLRLAATDAAAAGKQAASEMRESVAAGLGEAKDRAIEKTEDFKQSFADQIGKTAEALGGAADGLRDQAVPQELLREAAKGLTSFSQALEGRSLGDIVADLSDLGRRNPVAFLGSAALAGFALSRFAQASASHGVGDPAPRTNDYAVGADDHAPRGDDDHAPRGGDDVHAPRGGDDARRDAVLPIPANAEGNAI